MHRDFHVQPSLAEGIETPIVDQLIKLRKTATLSFHALPLSGGSSIANSFIRDKYEELFGDAYLRTELTITGKNFDSLFFSEGVIKKSENLAARLYGADETLFITTGTTTANQVAITAMCHSGARVLMDKTCHQSLHFSFNALGVATDYLTPSEICLDTGRAFFDLEELLEKTRRADDAGKPYDLIVLNAHSYDGIVYNIPLIIKTLLSTGTATRRFLIDEAWAGANPFSDQLRRCASLNAVHLRKEYEDLCIVATQSAHKALSCLRQASMLHVYGSDEMVHKLRTARYRIHTSSPSYPILASLDLARAQMSRDGNELVQQATLLAKEFVENIEADPSLSSYRINSFSLPVLSPYVVIDPTKVSLNVSELTSSTLEFRDLIYANYGIYINRVTKSSLLLNFHIGITSDAVQKILKALRELQRRFIPEWLSSPVTDAFIVPYPPGVPIAIPGEEMTIQMRSQIRSLTRSGSHIFVV